MLYTLIITPISVSNYKKKVLHADGKLERTLMLGYLMYALISTYGIVDTFLDEFDGNLMHVKTKAGVHILDIAVEETPSAQDGVLAGV